MHSGALKHNSSEENQETLDIDQLADLSRCSLQPRNLRLPGDSQKPPIAVC